MRLCSPCSPRLHRISCYALCQRGRRERDRCAAHGRTLRPNLAAGSAGPLAGISVFMSVSGVGTLLLEHVQFETRCVLNHTPCRFAEKRGFSVHVWPGGAVLPPRVLPCSMAKRFRLEAKGASVHRADPGTRKTSRKGRESPACRTLYPASQRKTGSSPVPRRKYCVASPEKNTGGGRGPYSLDCCRCRVCGWHQKRDSVACAAGEAVAVRKKLENRNSLSGKRLCGVRPCREGKAACSLP